MSLKISKADKTKIASFMVKLDQLRERLPSAVDDINCELRQLVEDKLTPLVDEYNQVLEDAENHLSGIIDTAEEFIEERSEAWKEDDRGAAAYDWTQRLRDVSGVLASAVINIGHINIDVDLGDLDAPYEALDDMPMDSSE